MDGADGGKNSESVEIERMRKKRGKIELDGAQGSTPSSPVSSYINIIKCHELFAKLSPRGRPRSSGVPAV